MVLIGDAVKNPKHSGATAAHSHFFGDFIIENECADTVALMEDSPRSESRDLCRDYRFHGKLAAEEHIDALVDDQHGGPVTLFGINAHIGLLHSRSYSPVDAAYVVASDVAAKLLEVETAPAHV